MSSLFFSTKAAILFAACSLGCIWGAEQEELDEILRSFPKQESPPRVLSFPDNSGEGKRRRVSESDSSLDTVFPEVQVYNTALQTAVHKASFASYHTNADLKGRLVKSCVGAHLLSHPNTEVFYWRENNKEVDFVVKRNEKIIAIEVKSGKTFKTPAGLEVFSQNVPTNAKLLVGQGGIPLDIFLKTSLDHFV